MGVNSLRFITKWTTRFPTLTVIALSISVVLSRVLRRSVRLSARSGPRSTRIFDKKSNRTTTYRSEIARSGQEVVFVITDMATNEVVTRKVFPPAEPHAVPRDCTPGPYATLPECYADYHCLCGLALQCIADRTCETQYDSYICCANRGTPNETCVSAHLYFAPSSLRCQVLNPDILGGGIAIRQ